MNEALIEGQSVDEGLERGARGASGSRAVHLPGNGAAEKVRRTDQRADLHARPVDEQRGGVVQPVPSAASGKALHGPFQNLLNTPVHKGAHGPPFPGKGQKLARCVRRVKRQRRRSVHAKRRELPLAGTAQAERSALLRGVPPRQHKTHHAGAGGLEIRAVQRAAPYGILRHDSKRRALGKRQARRRNMKVHPRGRADAFHVASVGRKIEVGFENLAFFVVVFVLKRAGHLFKLARHRGGVKPEPQPCHLHGDGGASHAPRAAQHGEPRPQHGKRIHAGMPVEMPVLVPERGVHGFGRNFVQTHAQPELLVARQAHAERLSLPVQHQRRKIHAVQKRRLRSGRKPEPEKNQRQRHQAENDFPHHGAHATSRRRASPSPREGKVPPAIPHSPLRPRRKPERRGGTCLPPARAAG